MPKPTVAITVRMSPEQHEALALRAQNAGLSVNAYVLWAIQEARKP